MARRTVGFLAYRLLPEFMMPRILWLLDPRGPNPVRGLAFIETLKYEAIPSTSKYAPELKWTCSITHIYGGGVVVLPHR